MRIMVFAACAALAACGSNGGGTGNAAGQAGNGSGQGGNEAAGGNNAAAAPGGGEQQLTSREGAAVGTASVQQAQDGLAVRVAARGLPQGVHGVHLHAVGRCDQPGFESAGPHWNPTNREHGPENPDGAHLGDLPNMTVGADGSGTLEFTVPNARLSDGQQPLFDADGAALVIHASADDYRTDPSGNSGDRIACAVLQPGS